MANYSLTIVATDKGEPPLSSSMEVTMIVLDVIDNTPSFSQNIYDIEIEENTLSRHRRPRCSLPRRTEPTSDTLLHRRRNLKTRTPMHSWTGVISVRSFWIVLARDDDLGSNGQISYSLNSGNDAGAFSLTSGGQLNLIRTLDREAQDKYTLIITAHDA
ncbi:hypothetical protein cypCar_00046341, partial [Cyprinus carpio]